MTSLLSGLAPWMPWILVGLGVAALVVLGVITWLLLGNTVPEDEGSESPPELTDTTAPLWALNASETLRGATGLSTAHLSRAAGVFSPLLIRNSIRKSLRTVRKFAPRRIGRGDEPWILALGPDGSGKREVLEGLTLPRVLPELAREPVGWYVFDQGVVLDVPESLIQDASGAGDDRGWDSFLSALVGVRPERPADGVVLVLPARDLLASEASSEGSRFAEQLEDQLFRRLQRAQAVLGLRFPVHVLIHGLEDIPGFSAFSEALPEGLRQEIFGWSSPYPLESAFQSDWTQEAFREIGERLEKISTEILATQATGDHANEIFRFPERFEHLRTRTTSLLDALFRDTAYHEGFFLRGIYFSAGPGTSAEGRAILSQGSTPPSLFTTRLFQRKIFPERGLATVFRSGLLDRNRRVRALQIFSALVVVLGIPGLLLGSYRLRASTASVNEVLVSLETSIEQMRRIQADPSLSISASGADDSVFVALARMSELNRSDFRALALPDSWIRPLDPLIDFTLRMGIQEVVIPILRGALLEWADTLRTSPRFVSGELGGARVHGTTGAGGGLTSTAAPLAAYLTQVDSLTQNIGHYNAVATSDNLDPFEKLVNWYFEQPLPPGFRGRGSFVRVALAEARDEPIRPGDRPDFNDVVLDRSIRIVESIYADLVVRVEALDDALSTITSGRSEFLANDLLRLVDDMAQLERFLDRSGAYWLNPNLPLGPEIETLIQGIPDAGIFSGSLFAVQFRRDFDRLRAARLTEISQLPAFARVVGPFPLSEPGAPEEARFAPALESLATGIRALGAQRFMMAMTYPSSDLQSAVGVPQFGALPRWSAQPLEDVIRLIQDARTFEASALEQFPPSLHGALREVISEAVEERVREAVSAAMVWERAPEPSGRRERERELGVRIQNFDEAARALIQILELEDGPGGSSGLTSVLAQVVLTEILDLLLEADRLLEESRPYQASFTRWNGRESVNLAAFGLGSMDELEGYLAQQREGIQGLSSRYVSRILGYAALPPVDREVRFGGGVASTASLERLARWQGIVRSLEQYEAQEPGNPLGELERMIRFDLQAERPSACPVHAAPAPALTSNYFVLAAQRLDRGFRQRCAELARIQIERDYLELQTFFQANLAGRAPFVPASALASAPEADPFSLRELLSRYDRLRASLGVEPASVLRSLPDDQGAAQFLRDLESLVPVLRLALGEPDLPETAGLGVRIDFRTSRTLERGGDQIVEWALSIGDQQLRLGDTVERRSVIWRPGDPIAVRFRWATGSSRRPLPTPGATLTEASQIEFRQTGPWSLLRLVAAATPTLETQRSLGLPGGPLEAGTLLFSVPTALTPSADVLRSPTGPSEVSVLFLRVRLFDPVSGAPMDFPRFPLEAPGLRF